MYKATTTMQATLCPKKRFPMYIDQSRGDDVQAKFWKLLNNANFGFDCRDNSQNKRLHLIYDKNVEVEFIGKYSKYDTFYLSKFFCYITGSLYHLIRHKTGQLKNEAYMSNPIVSSKK